ncbi:hypothetical protein O6H91_05G068200 [Diphasiastrum complanatum]|uniref:Uncharacterized protein n=1 Tax=Diphasiastrum complanatum TaxID=34168 RepID=A0ACC2DPJ6_DIPCM|nr:hypothetical protein O6H91_05G068200 [Diphasiastrum complanatum]
MKRLGDLAHKVQHSEGKTRGEVVQPSENQAVSKLKTEMSNVFFRLGKEDSDAAESRQREDYEVTKISKVGESVVLEEQRGGNERKRMNTVKKQNRFDKPSISVYRSMPSECNNCRRKDRSIMDLKETLHEKDFFMMAMIEDANLQRQEKTELDAELVSAKAAFVNIRKRLAQEVEEREADFKRHVEEVSWLRGKLREAAVELELALEELSSLKKKIASITRASRRGEALNKKLRKRMNELQKSREEILSRMQRRDRVASEEIDPAARRRRTIQEKRRSRNISEERPNQIGNPGTSSQTDKSAGKRGAIAGFEKLQSAEIERMRSTYEQQIRELKNQVKYFQEKVRVQESSIAQRINDEEQKLTDSGKYKDITIGSSFEKVTEGSQLNNVRHLRDSEMAVNRLQHSMTKDLLTQYMGRGHDREQELEKWKKLYRAAKVTIDLLQSDLHKNFTSSRISPQASSRAYPSRASDLIDHTQREQNWVRNIKGQQEAEWEQRRSNERIALERQTRAKDERLKALRQQLLRMEKEATQNQEEIKMLKDKLRFACTKEAQQS